MAADHYTSPFPEGAVGEQGAPGGGAVRRKEMTGHG